MMGLCQWRSARGRRASVFLVSLIVVLVAAVGVIAWVGYISEVQRQSDRDRARVHAFEAAEAGIEQVIDWFNNPGFLAETGNYQGAVPEVYGSNGWNVSPYGDPFSESDDTTDPTLSPPPYANDYELFEPFVTGVVKTDDGKLVLDSDGNPMPNSWTYFLEPSPTIGTKIPTCELEVPDTLRFTNNQGQVIAEVTKLILVNPEDFDDPAIGDTLPSRKDRIICKVIAEARSTEYDDMSVTIETDIKENPMMRLRSPGALLARTGSKFQGQYQIHWGDFWSETDIIMNSNFNSPSGNFIQTSIADKWLDVKTEGLLYYADTTQYCNGEFAPEAVKNVPDSRQRPYLGFVGHGSTKKFEGYDNLYQRYDLDFESYAYDYQETKDFFLSNGMPYFFTDAGDNKGENAKIYGYENGQLVGKSFYEWFNISDASDPSYWDSDKLLVFIDTFPQNDKGEFGGFDENGIPIINSTYYPRDPSDAAKPAKVATINLSGGIHTRGAMFVAANMNIASGGNGVTNTDIIDPATGGRYVLTPDGQIPTSQQMGSNVNIHHNGLMFTWGGFSGGGNYVVYGSINTMKDFSSNGGREVYYNWRMEQGNWLSANMSKVNRSSWRVRKEGTPDISSL